MKVNVAAYDQLLGRLLSIGVPEGGIAEELSPEISPVFVLENDRPEWCYLKGERCCAGYSAAAGGAASTGSARFANPVNSGVIAILESIRAYGSAATQFAIYWNPGVFADLANLDNTRQVVDSRSSQKPACRISNTTGGGAGVAIEFMGSAAGYSFIDASCCPLILHPGNAVDIANADNNLTLKISFRWREREQRIYERADGQQT